MTATTKTKKLSYCREIALAVRYFEKSVCIKNYEKHYNQGLF